MFRVMVDNVDTFGMSKPYIVARIWENALWYWSAWDKEEDAEKSAKECGGIIVYNTMEG